METARCSKRVAKPNTKYINQHFTTEPEIKTAISAKKSGPVPANKKTKATVSKATVPKATVSKATVLKLTVPKATVPKATVSKATVSKATVSKATVSKATVSKATVPRVVSKSALLPIKTSEAASSKVVQKKVKYRIDFAAVADLVRIPDFRKFLTEELEKNDTGRVITVKERKLQIIVKCKKFLKKENVRIALKKYLKKLNIVHLTKVQSSSKSVYTVLMK